MSQGLRSADLDYPFDPRHIATQPAEPRDAARMMVVERASGAVHHAHVRDLPQWLRASDTLVVNRTRVAHARLLLRREADGRELEGLLAAPLPGGAWLLLAKGGKRLREGDRLQMLAESHEGTVSLTCERKTDEGWQVRFDAGVDAHAALDGIIHLKVEDRGATQHDPLHHGALDKAAFAVEFVQHGTGLLGRTDHADEDAGVFQVHGSLDIMHGHEYVGKLEVLFNAGTDLAPEQFVDTVESLAHGREEVARRGGVSKRDGSPGIRAIARASRARNTR